MRRETPYPGGLDAARAYGRQSIDEAAGQARLRYITEAPGQQLTYQRKSDEVDRWEVTPEAERVEAAFRMIYASARAYGETPDQAYMRIKTSRDMWTLAGAAIEEIREAGKRAVDAAQTVQEAIVASRTAVAQLGVV